MQARAIPSIEQLMRRPTIQSLEARYGRQAVLAALRDEAQRLRERLAADSGDEDATLPDDAAHVAEALENQISERLGETFAGSLRPVINATGVIVHTNLGRAPLSRLALERLTTIAQGYANLEYDLQLGSRGARDTHAAALLTRLTGAEAAVVVNNNAAATLLILSTLAAGRDVVISRGELVEIGGGFRVPDVMAQSGAVLREVGTTNKTRIADYESAIGDRTALILRVHRSNFRIEGFTEQPTLQDLVALGRRARVPVVEDLGSGWMLPSTGLLDEPDVQASVRAGLDVVCFSGDKLLGGPQAGIVVGRASLVERLRKHPLMRALRVDKLTYAALEATLLDYLAGRAAATIPVARMLALTADAIEQRARRVISEVGTSPAFVMEIQRGTSMIGGGSAPGIGIETRLLALRPRGMAAADLDAALRKASPPIVARVEQETVLLDLRTVAAEEDVTLVNVLRTL